MRFTSRPQATALLATTLALAPLWLACTAQAQTPVGASAVGDLQATRAYAIPAGPLSSALAGFAAQSGLLLSSDASLTTGKQTAGLQGDYSVEQGLQRLLAGSGLRHRFTERNAVTLEVAAPLVEGQVNLAPVSVVAGENLYGDAPTLQEQGYRAERSSASGFREKPVLDTPFSVSSFPAEVIRDQQAKSLIDLTKNDPSISQANSPLWYDRVNIRGFYLGVNAIQRDGLSINDQGSIALENKAAVEVAKGLSALRYGATSPGGVINYLVKRPTDEPLARVTLSGNDDAGVGAHGDFGGRFGDQEQFGLRVNMAQEDVQTYVDEVSGDKTFFSTFFDWRVNDRLLIELDYEYQKRDMVAPSTASISWFDSVDEARAFYRHLDAETFTGESWAKEPNEQNYYGSRVHYQLADNWKVMLAAQRGVLTRGQNAVEPVSLQANGDYDAFLYYSPDQERRNDAYQLVFEGDFDTSVLSHETAFGYDQLRRDMYYPDGFYGSIGSNNLFDPISIADPGVGSDRSKLQNRTEQSSVFFTDTISYSDWLQLYGGLRQTRIQGFSPDAGGRLTENYDEYALNPTLGLVIKPQADLSLYVSYAEGIEQGGTAPDNAVNRGEVMNPLESQQYEAGVKYELGGNALLTAAYFHIDKGLELLDGGNRYVQNGRQVHRGVEATLSGNLTPNLRMIAGLAYLEAEIQKTDDLSLIGKRPQGVPEWQANLFADYELSDWVEGLAVNGGIYYSGDKAIDSGNTWLADSSTRLDLGLRYRAALYADTATTWRLNVENVSNERYLVNTTYGALDFGAPRTVKASVELNF
ncbi:MAG: TonB-dependent receptor [Pseudomonadota bacterium]